MKVKMAKEAGYCFGVKRAMQMAWDELEANEGDIYALGPLIHNKQAVSKYEENGLKTIEEISDIPTNENIIIRSHGVSEEIYKEAEKRNLNVIDTTCPFVKKIHKIVKRYYEKGYKIILIGDSKHPEVKGINGWCNDSAIIIKTLEDAHSKVFDENNKYCLVSQTTINLKLYEEISKYLNEVIKDITINNTICSATKVRQEAARELAKEVDVMIVIGGKHSSNTQKLVQICKEYVETYSIETKEELDIEKLRPYNLVGVAAGASTPEWIINEVINAIERI